MVEKVRDGTDRACRGVQVFEMKSACHLVSLGSCDSETAPLLKIVNVLLSALNACMASMSTQWSCATQALQSLMVHALNERNMHEPISHDLRSLRETRATQLRMRLLLP